MSKRWIVTVAALSWTAAGCFAGGGQTKGTCVSGDCSGGQCTLSWSNGTYAGECKGRLPDGNGVGRSEGEPGGHCGGSSFAYVGHYKDGWMDGEGVIACNGGMYESYQGTFVHDHAQGKGVVKYRHGNEYKGDVVSLERHGTGTMTYHDGGSYTGGWVHGFRSGQGTMKYNDGVTYVGDWLKDKRHGHGTQTKADGTIDFDGNWVDDKPRR